MENQIKLKNNKDIIQFLVEKFPKAFTLTGEMAPLKVGIFKDISSRLADDSSFSKTQLRMALRFYTSRWRYLSTFKAGAQRIDLDGNVCGEVDPQHAEFAQEQLRKSKELFNKSNKDKVPASQKKVKQESSQQYEKKTLTVPPKPKFQKKKPAPESAKSVKDISLLTVGQKIKVKLGNNLTSATISKIEKDSVKVETLSGIEIQVRLEHVLL